MSDAICVIMLGSLIIGFIIGRWWVPNYCGDVIIAPDSETCTFSLEIPEEDIHLYRELVFRVVEKKAQQVMPHV